MTTTSSRPPLHAHPLAYLSPHATLIGTHPITLGPGCVIHPRARLVAVHGPVSVGAGSVVDERASVGMLEPSRDGDGDGDGAGGVVLEGGVGVECGATVEGRVVGEGSVVEVGARVGRGAVVGKHCKIAPLCVIPPYDILPDRTIVYGGGADGEQQHRRVEPEALQESRARVMGKHVEVLRTLMGGK